MKNSRQAYWVAWLVVILLCGMVTALEAAPGPSARLLRVEASVTEGSVRIEVKASAPFDFTTYRPNETLFIVDMAGVVPGDAELAKVLKSDIVSSYRVLPYRGGEKSMVRLEVLLRTAVEPQVERLGPDSMAVIFALPGAAQITPVKMTAPSAKSEKPLKTAASNAPATAIEQVLVRSVEKSAEVQIEGNGRMACEVTRLSNPDRVVLDFAGVSALKAEKAVASSVEPVKGIRVGRYKTNVMRVVIDLDRNEPHRVRARGNVVTVAFGPDSVASQTTSPAPAPVTETVSTSSVQTPAPAPVQAATQTADEPKATSTSPIDAEKLPLPANLTQASSALASPLPASSREAAPVTPDEPKPAPATAAPVSNAPQGAKGQGEPISVNLKDVDLKDFFRLIHEISGLNVVLDPNVRGTVTLVLDEVPWDQALDIVLRNNQLDKEIQGNVLRIATRDTMKKEAEAQRDLIKAQAEAVDQVTTSRTLSYAKAALMRDTLKRFLSSRGEILSDDRSNTLIIRDIPSVIPDLDNLIKQLDRRSQQVEIEARVVAASRAFAREIGTQFGFATTSTGGRNVFGGLVGQSSFTSPISRGTGLPAPPLVASGTNSIPFNSNLGATAPTSGVSFAHSSPNLALDFIISAAESKGVGKLLSKPKVITQNNEKAEVKQGTKIPVQTVINNTITVQFVDAVLKLEVTPQISADGTIFMDVLVENTAIDNGTPRVGGIPALTTQSAQTKVLINDGGTVVIGGVIISEQSTDIRQVPLLGSIPVIGHLFKHTTIRTKSQELLFFITPRIVPS
ncbi:MAG: type IV pilus secretin PilQ [Acidobacteria bacterium]|nr:type IV pilus secretin PilQ [Acidobacteriota bacterium]MCL5287402.1 type IV pilus secretin PilQ [Acidobacteriota bacterium]